jgi:hypothetical protein
MDTKAAVPEPKPFLPHPNFSDEVNRNIAQLVAQSLWF